MLVCVVCGGLCDEWRVLRYAYCLVYGGSRCPFSMCVVLVWVVVCRLLFDICCILCIVWYLLFGVCW